MDLSYDVDLSRRPTEVFADLSGVTKEEIIVELDKKENEFGKLKALKGELERNSDKALLSLKGQVDQLNQAALTLLGQIESKEHVVDLSNPIGKTVSRVQLFKEFREKLAVMESLSAQATEVVNQTSDALEKIENAMYVLTGEIRTLKNQVNGAPTLDRLAETATSLRRRRPGGH